MNFQWDPLDDQWYKNFNRLVEYKDLFGDCNVHGKDNEYKSLGA